MTNSSKSSFLVSNFDTIECAYYLTRRDDCTLDFDAIAVEKDQLARSKSKSGSILKLGSEEFLLASHGTKSGYPYLMENEAFIIQFGEFNKPNFFVKFKPNPYRGIRLFGNGIQPILYRIGNSVYIYINSDHQRDFTVSAYLKYLKSGISYPDILGSQSPRSLEDRFKLWFFELPEVTRNRPWSMSELEKALHTQGKYLSPILLRAGWVRRRQWNSKKQYHRYWVPTN